MKMGIILIVLMSLAPKLVAEERGLPLIKEHVDEIWIIRTFDNDYGRVAFIRDGNIAATRLLLDEMVWTIEHDKVQLAWRDYWTAERIVTADVFTTIVLPYDPTQAGQKGQWWCMLRNMRDLKQPD